MNNIFITTNSITPMPGLTSVVIPETITVHLGNPKDNAENITIPFIDYIKNVASSELYPTWPENALRANIYAISSIAMNRIYTEWYPSKGYNFNITNSTQFDQSYVADRGIYENISKIVDDIFGQYIIKNNRIEPYFASYCDGRIIQCDGLYQWGTVDLANIGYTPIEILKYYYGDDISIKTDNIVGNVKDTYPGAPIGFGSVGPNVILGQLVLNRIAKNFPAIPIIYPVTEVFGRQAENSVIEFQKIFNLEPTGIVDKATWYKIRNIYTAVKRLADLNSEGISISKISRFFDIVVEEGDSHSLIELLQYFLNILSTYYDNIPAVKLDGYYGPETTKAVIAYQKMFNLTETGIVDRETLSRIYESTIAIFKTLPPSDIELPIFRYPEIIFTKGMGIERVYVFVIQSILLFISSVIPSITASELDGNFGPVTEKSVIEFQKYFGLNPNGIVDEITWNELVKVYQELRYI